MFDNSTSTNEDITKTVCYIDEYKTVTMPTGTDINLTNASTFFKVGDTVIWGGGQPTPFKNNKTYYVIFSNATLLRISETKGGPAKECTIVGVAPKLYSGSAEPYPVLRPFPVSLPTSRNVLVVSYTWASSAYVALPFFTILSESTKPVSSSVFSRLSVFLYNSTDATILNRLWTPNCGFLFTNLKFTGSVNKAGTASFTVTCKGDQTAVEESLLLSDNYVAIISGESVVWSGKILRSEQVTLTLFAQPSNIKQWDIECESDISKMRFQDIKPANKGTITGSIGTVVSKIVEGVSPAINWNGTTNDPGLRSNEGPSITYTVTEADMFSQLTTLRNVIDFDMRTRLINQRYHYNSHNASTFYVTNFSPYIGNAFLGKWVLVVTTATNGIQVFGKCTYNGTNSLVINPCVNYTLIETSGTILVLGDPVLDFVSDLSQPSKQATFYMNAPWLTTPSFGYEFNDKTDRKLLATKVVAKGKTQRGDTIATSIAAVKPWNPAKSAFENTTVITHRTEGEIIQFIDGAPPAGASTIFLDGWGYVLASGDYVVLKSASGTTWVGAYSGTRVVNLSETILGGRRVTKFNIYAVAVTGWSSLFTNGFAYVVKASDYYEWPATTSYCSIYIKSSEDIGYINGMDIYICGETIETLDCVTDVIHGPRLRYVANGTAKHRGDTTVKYGAHIPGAIVWAAGSYSETAPDPESPVGYHGIILQTYTADQNVTLPILETYATMYLIAYSCYYRKASFWCPVHDYFRTDSRARYQLSVASFLQPGDRISCLPKSTDTETDTLYGQLKNIWQIVSYTLDANSLQVTVELGDFERNVFTLLADKTAAINQTIT